MEDRNKADVSFCLQMVNSCLQIGISEEDIHHIFKRGTDPDTPRPLMVQLTSYTFKNIIMESLFKLKSAEQKFKTYNHST